jgi:hypothetical protein
MFLKKYENKDKLKFKVLEDKYLRKREVVGY